MSKHLCLITIIVLLVCVLCSMAVMPVASAAGSIMEYAVLSAGGAYKAFDDFASNYSNRTVGTGYEQAAAKWLAQQLVAMGYTARNGSTVADDLCEAFNYTYTVSEGYYSTSEKSGSSYNVVAYKRCGVADAPLLVLAAPYSNEVDTDFGSGALGYEDAAYSASSVGVLLSVAAGLCADNMRGTLSFDVAFAFMGAEYFDMAGTARFIESNTQNLLGAIYLSQVGVGDDLNIYYDEITRTHGQYVDALIAKRSDFSIEGKPFAPGYNAQVYGGDLPYSHIGLSGGNYLFMQQGVPSVHLFGYKWSGLTPGESAAHGDIIYTKYDTKSNFLTVYGEDAVRDRLNTAADFLRTLVLTDKDFGAALTAARQDSSYQSLVSDAAYHGFRWSVVGLAVALAVVLLIVFMRRARKAGKPDFSVNSEFINGRSTQAQSEDIFGESEPIVGEPGAVDTDDEKDGNNTGNPPDTNDIFGEF